MAYDFVCIYFPNKMIKDVDGVCRHIDPHIHRYLVGATAIHSKEILLRPFDFNFDVFLTCSNSHHVSQNDVSPAFDTVSTRALT